MKKSRQNKIISLSLLAVTVMLLSGCWDKTELEQKAYVIAIGLDNAKEDAKVNITYLIANAEVGSAQTGGNTTEPPKETVTIRAADFVSARNIANSVVAREISYDLLRVILVSEEAASDREFLRHIYAAVKDRDVKRNVQLIVTKEKVQEFLAENKPKLETRPHKFYQYMIERGIETGLIPDSKLHHFFRVTEEDANMFLAAYATAGTQGGQDEFEGNESDHLAGDLSITGETNSTQFLGSAAFLEGQMIGTLTGLETRMVMLLNETSEVSDVLTTYPDPFNDKYRLTVRILKKKKSRVKMNLKKPTPSIDVTLPLQVEILTDPSMVNPAKDKQKVEKLRNFIESAMEKNGEEFITKTQKEFKADPFGWSLYARKEFKTLKEYMAFDWMKKYPEMDIKLNIEIDMGKFGKAVGNARI